MLATANDFTRLTTMHNSADPNH